MQTSEGTDRERIGARIRALREAAGLTQRALADKLGCSQSHIANIETGRDRATAEKRSAIAAALGVPVEDLERVAA